MPPALLAPHGGPASPPRRRAPASLPPLSPAQTSSDDSGAAAASPAVPASPSAPAACATLLSLRGRDAWANVRLPEPRPPLKDPAFRADRATFWDTVLPPAARADAASDSGSECGALAPAPPQPEPAMNIPCVLCGVRFRKPGHLNMHWRSVHAAAHSAAYPGSYSASHDGPAPPVLAPALLRAAAAPAAAPGAASGRVSKPHHQYGCPQCDARFRRGSDRNRHMRMVHERRRPFACALCPKQFGRKSFLEAHVSTVHMKQRPYCCTDCGAAFGQRSSLTRHARKIHGVGVPPPATLAASAAPLAPAPAHHLTQ